MCRYALALSTKPEHGLACQGRGRGLELSCLVFVQEPTSSMALLAQQPLLLPPCPHSQQVSRLAGEAAADKASSQQMLAAVAEREKALQRDQADLQVLSLGTSSIVQVIPIMLALCCCAN